MSKYTLTLLDTTGIQDYIFASNRLQENIGASELVYRATTLWVFDALEEAGIKNEQHNIKNPDSLDWEYRETAIEKEAGLQAEVIQAAGGNSLILFREEPAAKKFVQKLSLRLLMEAPGLTLLAQHAFFDFDTQNLVDSRKNLENAMRSHKATRLSGSPSLGLGVTAQCESTGLPAVRTALGQQKIGKQKFKLLVPGQDRQVTEQERLISRETTFKLAARDLANERLRHVLGTVAEWYDFPADIDNLGRVSGEESYVAVIHADGNKMGEHVASVINRLDRSIEPIRFNRMYIREMQAFSRKLEAASQAALVEIVETVVASIDENTGLVAGEIPIVEIQTTEKKYRYIPFRPLVFGGDDVTFLCNGQLGVELASRYLQAFESHTHAQGLENFFASAGVCIVKMHYPFARAYHLSEELAGSAKLLTRKEDCSALDWHFAQSGLSGSLENIRQREYTVEAGRVNLRPLTLSGWQQVENMIDEFTGPYWGKRHNKVIGLREALRNGPGAVEKYLQDYGLRELPPVGNESASKTGWVDDTCYYFDAIELLDHHVSLKKKESA